MTKAVFWRNASNWGFLGGAALFAVNLAGWALKLEAGRYSWIYDLFVLVTLIALIDYTGKRNAKNAGAAGYGYGRAMGFVLAMMMCAGVVYGVGKFLLINFLAPEYYTALNETVVDRALALYSNFPQFDDMSEMRESVLGWLRNPFYLIFQAVVELVFKGGFTGLVLCAFFTRKPELKVEN